MSLPSGSSQPQVLMSLWWEELARGTSRVWGASKLFVSIWEEEIEPWGNHLGLQRVGGGACGPSASNSPSLPLFLEVLRRTDNQAVSVLGPHSPSHLPGTQVLS